MCPRVDDGGENPPSASFLLPSVHFLWCGTEDGSRGQRFRSHSSPVPTFGSHECQEDEHCGLERFLLSRHATISVLLGIVRPWGRALHLDGLRLRGPELRTPTRALSWLILTFLTIYRLSMNTTRMVMLGPQKRHFTSTLIMSLPM